MFELLLLALLLTAAWFWLDSIAKREIAINYGRELAQRCNLQLLDETVACNIIRLGRDNRGHAQLLRIYEFDVSANGADRMQCNLQLLGKQLQTWHIPPYAQADSAASNVYKIH
ncbi:MAG: DUF3301 domain-containing protein [Bdellovibrio sp.]|nr:DUF3301 domain-containing protein [Methylotenera sp.]